ncbi:MAG: ABC transporter substrate-binding protein [Treponema sp.]|nr:ABC transporter substrate-binding protein [Treponema sp.]MCL2250504.1 ABC transporter substrate-binding protein [Treponema sp.]
MALTVISCSQKNKKNEYITIGALLPLTGEDSDEGLRALNGIQLAKKEINSNGGVLGKMIDIIVLNDKGDEQYVVQQYNTLKEKGVSIIIGSSYSDPTIALVKSADEETLIISPSASNPDVTKGRKNVFRAIFIDDYQAEVMAYFAFASLEAKTALVLKNANFIGYQKTADVFIEEFINYGGEIMAVENYSSENDFPRILQRYYYNKPDVIFCSESYLLASKLVNAVYNTGLRGVKILGSDAWDGLLAYVTNPEAMKNVYYSAPFSFDDQDEKVIQFVMNYYTAFSQIPLSGSATAYTCVYILAEAIKLAGNVNTDDLVSALKANVLNVITGHIEFDENNNPHTNVYIMQIDGGVYSSYQKLSL